MMLARFEIPECSKGLYFKLSGSLQLCSYHNCNQSLKLAGVYAIFKNDVCYYVGQSQNIASRVAQHLSGKYENADKVVVFPVVENGFSDFYERSKESRKSILENNEFKFMEYYKPIENLITPGSDFEYNENGFFNCLDDDMEEFYAYGHIEIYRQFGHYDITTGIGSCMLEGEAYKYHNEWVASVTNHFGYNECVKRGIFNG